MFLGSAGQYTVHFCEEAGFPARCLEGNYVGICPKHSRKSGGGGGGGLGGGVADIYNERDRNPLFPSCILCGIFGPWPLPALYPTHREAHVLG